MRLRSGTASTRASSVSGRSLTTTSLFPATDRSTYRSCADRSNAMSNQTATRTLAELVTERGARARVFERFHLDYCCGGQRALADACADVGCDVDDVLAELDTSAATAPEAQP